MKYAVTIGVIVCAVAMAPALSAQGSGAAKPAPAQGTKPVTTKPAAAAQSPKSTVAAADLAFAKEAAMGSMAEVELGRLASDKATNADVKQFASRMVTDHGKANDELKSWASSNSVTLPSEVGASEKAFQAKLSKMSGEAFDKAYASHMVADHAKDVAAFQRASKTAKNADLKAWAASTLPTLQEHHKMARDINAKVGTASKTAAAKKSGGN